MQREEQNIDMVITVVVFVVIVIVIVIAAVVARMWFLVILHPISHCRRYGSTIFGCISPI